jgi:sec-independent protein translocase protein TatC
VSMGVTTPDKLARKRPYVIIGVFVIGMVLTPPDIISQTLLALPMWLLFEIGLGLSRVMLRRREQEAARSGGDGDEAGWSQEDIDEGKAGPKPKPGAAGAAAGGAATPAASTAEAEEFRPMSDSEMDAELDRLAEEEARGWQAPGADAGAGEGADDDGDGTGESADDSDKDEKRKPGTED